MSKYSFSRADVVSIRNNGTNAISHNERLALFDWILENLRDPTEVVTPAKPKAR